MLRMCASNSHSYTHLIQALGIVREPTEWVFITSKYPGIHDIGLPTVLPHVQACLKADKDVTLEQLQGDWLSMTELLRDPATPSSLTVRQRHGTYTHQALISHIKHSLSLQLFLNIQN